MEDLKTFRARMEAAKNDREKTDEIIKERIQMFVDEIQAAINPYNAVDEPFILATLKAVEKGFEKNCDQKVLFMTYLMLEKMEIDSTKCKHTKK